MFVIRKKTEAPSNFCDRRISSFSSKRAARAIKALSFFLFPLFLSFFTGYFISPSFSLSLSFFSHFLKSELRYLFPYKSCEVTRERVKQRDKRKGKKKGGKRKRGKIGRRREQRADARHLSRVISFFVDAL